MQKKCLTLLLLITSFSGFSTSLAAQGVCNSGPCSGPGPIDCVPCTKEGCATCNTTCASPCDPCDPPPCAPTCGTACGISCATVGIGVLAVAGVAAIVLASGGDPAHSH